METKSIRPGWDEYFMTIAKDVSLRSTCNRAKVGALIVSPSHDIIATGYGGSIPGLPHCSDVGCDMLDGHCVRTVHAEMNAFIRAASIGHAVNGGTLYCNVAPCLRCFMNLVSAGINRFVADVSYAHPTSKSRVDEIIKLMAANGRIVTIDVLRPEVGHVTNS